MAKKPGDVNYSLREKKHLAQIEKLKADVAAARAQVKVKDAQLKETAAKLRAAIVVATKSAAQPKKMAVSKK
jgi:hypothetical protein